MWIPGSMMFLLAALILAAQYLGDEASKPPIPVKEWTEEEKLIISQRHLVPRQIEENGLSDEMIEFSENALKALIADYTREAGLRSLERAIASVCRKVARQVAEGKKTRVRIIASSLEGYLGPAIGHREEAMAEDQVGASTGLAWTESGGDVLFVETT